MGDPAQELWQSMLGFWCDDFGLAEPIGERTGLGKLVCSGDSTKHSSRAAVVEGGNVGMLPNLNGGGTSHPADLVGTAEVVSPLMRERQGLVRVGLRLLLFG